MEKALKSLEELAKHNKLLNPAPIEGYKSKLKKRWETVCQQVCSVLVLTYIASIVCLKLSLSLSFFPSLPPPRLRAGKSSVLVAKTT